MPAKTCYLKIGEKNPLRTMKLSKLLKQLCNLVLTLLVLLGHYIINSQISLKVIILENV